MFLFCFWDRIVLYHPGWLWTKSQMHKCPPPGLFFQILVEKVRPWTCIEYWIFLLNVENSFQMCTILEIKRGMSSWPIYWRLGVHGLMPAVDIVSVISFTLALCHVRSGTLTEAYGFSIWKAALWVKSSAPWRPSVEVQSSQQSSGHTPWLGKGFLFGLFSFLIFETRSKSLV